MIRKLSLAAVVTASAAALVALSACSRQGGAPQQATQPATTTAPTDATAASTATSSQPAAAAQAPAAASGTTSDAQASDAGSTSLEHLAALPTDATLPSSSEWKPGVNYDVISPAQPTTVSPGKVEVLEVFWLACPHCYALEPYIRKWLQTKPAYVDFVRVPVVWDPMHTAHAQLFYTLETLGGDALVEKVFAYIHNQETLTGSEAVLYSSNSPDETFKQQQAWAVENGVSADAFAKAYNSFYVNTQLKQAQEILAEYQVTEVPYLAVDGRFSTDVGKAGGEEKVISLIDFLAAWEHDHKQGAG
jgi:thiol:disulfide interchange protein DsbA